MKQLFLQVFHIVADGRPPHPLVLGALLLKPVDRVGLVVNDASPLLKKVSERRINDLTAAHSAVPFLRKLVASVDCYDRVSSWVLVDDLYDGRLGGVAVLRDLHHNVRLDIFVQ